jgi:hypothetical protein
VAFLIDHLNLCPARPVLGRVAGDRAVLPVLLERFFDPPKGYDVAQAE